MANVPSEPTDTPGVRLPRAPSSANVDCPTGNDTQDNSMSEAKTGSAPLALDPLMGNGPKVSTKLEVLVNRVSRSVGGVLGGTQLRPIMLMSRLDTSVLGKAWSTVDIEKTGKLTLVGHSFVFLSLCTFCLILCVEC